MSAPGRSCILVGLPSLVEQKAFSYIIIVIILLYVINFPDIIILLLSIYSFLIISIKVPYIFYIISHFP